MISRDKPSAKYQPRIDMLRKVNTEGFKIQGPDGAKNIPAEQVFTGLELLQFAAPIKELIDKHSAKTLLEYGCGKGKQYEPLEAKGEGKNKSINDIKSYWKAEHIACFDSAIADHATLYEENVDGVICINHLQYYDVDDLSWIVRELFSKTKSFVFVNVICYSLPVQLPDKMLFHATVRNPTWWAGFINAIANDFPDIDFRLGTTSLGTQADGRQTTQQNWAARITT